MRQRETKNRITSPHINIRIFRSAVDSDDFMITSAMLGINRNTKNVMSAEWADDDFVVLFDEHSGETLKLNLVERTAFDCLDAFAGQVGFEPWVHRVARELDVPADEEFRSYLSSFIEQLEQLGLVHCNRP